MREGQYSLVKFDVTECSAFVGAFVGRMTSSLNKRKHLSDANFFVRIVRAYRTVLLLFCSNQLSHKVATLSLAVVCSKYKNLKIAETATTTDDHTDKRLRARGYVGARGDRPALV